MHQRVLAFRFSLSVAVLAAVTACRDDARQVAAAPRSAAPERGDSVVVEQTAAVFFEGRVLSVDGQRLRVQSAGDKSSVAVAASDVYRLPAPGANGGKLERPLPGEFAICRDVPQSWRPCRIESVGETSVRAAGPAGERFEVPNDGVLEPSPVTALNLRRHFERTRERLAFDEARARAGEPRPPAEFRPSLKERVLARGEGGWYSAYVREFEDDTVLVTWQSDRGVSAVPKDSVVPEPPYASEIRRGDFVLMRPLTPALPWPAALVRAVANGELRTVDADGRQHTVSIREVVPLGHTELNPPG
jgi:hypothetical protein